jgi:hypothetical protein
MHATFTKLPNGDILDTFLSMFSHMIITRLYTPEYDEYGDFHAPFSSKIVIDKIQSPTKNMYLVDVFIEKRHNEILKTILI